MTIREKDRGPVPGSVSDSVLREFAPFPYQSLNTDGEIITVNDAWIETLGYEREAVEGEWFGEFLANDSENLFASGFPEFVSTGDVSDVEFKLRRADGETIVVSYQGTVEYDEDGSVIRTHCQFKDLTELKQYQQDIERQNERLEEFTSVVSHDLRNPLNVAVGRLELAQDECDSDHLGEVARALDRMEALTDNLLTLAREGRSVESKEPVDLAEISNVCWQNVPTHDATLVVESEQKIRAEANRIQQLFENLLRNAVEHGGRDVTITIGDLEDGFYVADDGPGIPEEKRERVFDSGYSTREQNTGFGLSIVKEIVEAHGWEIRVTESASGGAQFEIAGVGNGST